MCILVWTPLIEPINRGLSTLSFAPRFAPGADSARVISRLPMDNSIYGRFQVEREGNRRKDTDLHYKGL